MIHKPFPTSGSPSTFLPMQAGNQISLGSLLSEHTPATQDPSMSGSTTWPTHLQPAQQTPQPIDGRASAAESSEAPASQAPSATQTFAARPSKRQKVSLACQECRDRKTKCDGARPICGTCAKKKRRENECVYEPERGRRGVHNQYVQQLENKVKVLEQMIRSEPRNGASPYTGRSSSGTTEHSSSMMVQGHNVNTIPFQNPFTTSPPQSLPSADRMNIPVTNLSTLDSSSVTNLTSEPALEPRSTEAKTYPSIQTGDSISEMSASLHKGKRIWEDDGISRSSISTDNSQQDGRNTNQGGLEVDAMGAVTGNSEEREMLDENENEYGYFGSSSAMSFMREVRQAIGKKASLSSDRQPRSSSRRSVQQNSVASPSTTDSFKLDGTDKPRSSSDLFCNYVLPPRKVAEELLLSYWTYVHTLYPFLHKPSFIRTYSKLWGYPEEDNDGQVENSESDPLFQCILNLVFALGCQLSPDINPSERETISDVFFQRSKKLLSLDILEVSSIKVVQALLLMGQYLQCTKSPGRCWIVVGLAIRIAQGLGLHMQYRDDHQKPGSSSRQLQIELRKRLWSGCIVLDRMISMAYGRPFMIPVHRDLQLPQIIDDELLSSYPNPPAGQPEDKPSHMAFFVYTLQLYEIMGDILITLYSGGNKRSLGENIGPAVIDRAQQSQSPRPDGDEKNRATKLNSIIRLEIALSTWEQSLPWFLGLYRDKERPRLNPSDYRNNRILIRQSNVLRSRYLHICILLYRPLFVYFFASEESNHSSSSDIEYTELQQSIFSQSSTICVRVVQELVDIIHDNTDDLLPAWWYKTFYIYTSATVLLMARLFPKIKQSIGEEKIADSWNKCLECLSNYSSYSSTAKRCYEYMNDLDKIAFQNNSEQVNPGISTIQILGTLPNQTANLATPIADIGNKTNQNQNGASDGSISFEGEFLNQWDFDVQDMSLLGRLPVYSDLAPGIHVNQWLGNFLTM